MTIPGADPLLTAGAAATARGRRRSVMADVAARAGVSQMTVSRVINNTATVRPDTRTRVLEAMRALDYHPNTAARALATGRSRTLGVVSHHATLHGPSATLRAIEHTAAEAGYTAMTVSVERFDPVVVRDAVDRLRRQGVDGLVIMAPHIAAIEAVEQLDVDVPVVTVHGRSGASPAVLIDQDAGARRATELLLSLGHASVWHLAGPQDWLEAAARTRAWADALRSRDLEPPPVLIGDWSAQSGYELGRRLLEQREVSAVFAANDQMALGLYRAAHEQGRRVPHDLSIVGFDDIAEAAYFSPPLTTVRQDFAQVGRWSLELLVDQLEHDTPVVTRLVDADLVVRDSTAPPPG